MEILAYCVALAQIHGRDRFVTRFLNVFVTPIDPNLGVFLNMSLIFLVGLELTILSSEGILARYACDVSYYLSFDSEIAEARQKKNNCCRKGAADKPVP